ncbi:hypothetical protein BDM02DRAFT_3111584, partial [Thelephora ganbajun]
MGGSFTVKKRVFDNATALPPCTTEMYLSHGEFEGGLFSSPTQRRSSNARNSFCSSFSPHRFHSYPIQMAYSNNNASFYSTSSAFGEFYTYPPPGRMLATGGSDVHAHHTLADRWGTAEWPGPVVGSSTNLQVAANG